MDAAVLSTNTDITLEQAQNVIASQNGFQMKAGEVWCRFFSDNFFGYSVKFDANGNRIKDFTNFSLAHFIPLILFGVAIFLIWKFRNFFKNWKFEENFRFIWAAVMIFVEMSYFWRLLYVGSSETGQVVSLLDKLPLQVCEWTCIISSFMLMKKKDNWMFQLCFYVCLIAGTCALVIPETVLPYTGPGYYRYYQFWLEHMLPTLSVFYLMFVHGFKPRFKGMFAAMGFLSVLGVISIICNHTLKDHNAEYLYFYLFDDYSPFHEHPWLTPIFFAVAVFGAFVGLYYLSKGIIKLREKYLIKHPQKEA